MKSFKIRKTMAIALLLIIALLTSAFTFAYWANGVEGAKKTANGNVTIGSAQTATTYVNVNDVTDSKTLVPVGKASYSSSANPVESITLTFTVDWKSTNTNAAKGTAGTLTATVKSKTIGGQSTNSDLVNTTLSQPVAIIADGEAVTVTMTVTLTEPSTKAIYDAIANKAVQIQVEFNVAVNS